jgi:hypothetical protein
MHDRDETQPRRLEKAPAPQASGKRNRIMTDMVASFVTAVMFLLPTSAQVNLSGLVRPQHILNISTTNSSNSGRHPFTHIWAFSPPNGSNGQNDNGFFQANVMPDSHIEGVSLLEAWSNIETVPPDSVVCAPSDLCQPDPAIPGMFHHYSWSTYDTTGSTSPVYQWLSTSFGGQFKKINLLITPASGTAANSNTPHYVTSSAWYNLFSPQQQDVINAIKDCTGVPWKVSGSNVSASIDTTHNTVVVTDTKGCCGPSSSQSSAIQDQDMVWVSATPSSCGTGVAGATVGVQSGSTTQFSYSLPTGCSGSITGVSYIGTAQSWAVPYEYPFKAALKAFWAAVVVHYGPNFSLNGQNYYQQLNYFRFGGSVGSEWYPYCVSAMQNYGTPYLYVKQVTVSSPCPNGPGNCTGWLNYYQEMGNYLQSLAPPFRIIHSINSAETSPVDYTYADIEASYAVTWSNAFGVRDGFGSQGLSANDYVACVNHDCDTPGTGYNSASNWHPNFHTYSPYGVALELQPEAISYPGDTACTNPACGTGDGKFSGDLPTFLYNFATDAGLTDAEIYWRDLSLAYDVNNYCNLDPTGLLCNATLSITPGGQLLVNNTDYRNQFFQAVGQGNGTYCGNNNHQNNASGNCAYQNNINQAQGQH